MTFLQNLSPASWKLATKVIEECSEKLKPSIVKTVVSVGFCLEDHAPVISFICKDELNTLNNLKDDSVKHEKQCEPSADKTHSLGNVESLMAIRTSIQNGEAGTIIEGLPKGSETVNTASKRGRKPKSRCSDEGYGNRTKGKVSPRNPNSHLKSSPEASKSVEKAMPTLENGASKVKQEVVDLEHKQLHQATPFSEIRKKRGRPPKRDVSGGSGNKCTTGSSGKDSAQANSAPKSWKKRASPNNDDDDVIETPFGRKNYKEDLVGCRIKVWWPMDRRYYEGVISSFESVKDKHRVEYDDGDRELLNLRKERWEFVGDKTSADVGLLADKRSGSHSDLEHKETPLKDEKETPQPPSDEQAATSLSGDRSKQDTEVRETSKTPEIEGNRVSAVRERSKTPKIESEAKRKKKSHEQES